MDIWCSPYLCTRMNLEVLLKEYANDTRCFQIADKITLSKPQQIQLSGLQGSAISFVLAAVFNHRATSQLNHLVILRDAEEAAYFHNTFENITSRPPSKTKKIIACLTAAT